MATKAKTWDEYIANKKAAGTASSGSTAIKPKTWAEYVAQKKGKQTIPLSEAMANSTPVPANSPVLANPAQNKLVTKSSMDGLSRAPGLINTANLLENDKNIIHDKAEYDSVKKEYDEKQSKLKALDEYYSNQRGGAANAKGTDAEYSALQKDTSALGARIDNYTNQNYADVQKAVKKGYELPATYKNADYDVNVEKGKKTSAPDTYKLTADDTGTKINYILNPKNRDFIDSMQTDTTYKKYAYMTDAEKNTVAYYAGKGDNASVKKYLATIDRDLNARFQTNISANAQKFSEEHPLLSGAAAAATSLTSGTVATVGGIAQNVKNAVTGRYEPIDPNSPYMSLTNAKNDLSAGVTASAAKLGYNIGQKIGGKSGAETGQMVGEFLGQTVMSIFTNGVQIALTGPASLYFMATDVAGSTINEVTRNGGTANQALALGALYGGIELLTEYISVDSLFDLVEKVGKTAGKTVFDTLPWLLSRQILVEGGEELASQYLDTFANMKVLGGNSEYNRYINQLVSGGMSESEATKKAAIKFFITDPAVAMLGGMISGGVMGAGGAVVSGVSSKIANKAQTVKVPSASQNVPGNASTNINTEAGKTTNTAGTEASASMAENATAEAPANTADTGNNSQARYANEEITLPTFSEKEKAIYIDNVKKSAKSIGINNIVSEKIESPAGTSVNGYYDRKTKTIHVSDKLNSAQVLNRVIGHEVTHSAISGNAGFASEIVSAIKGTQYEGRYDVKNYRKAYTEYEMQANDLSHRKAKMKVGEAYINEEIAADFVGDLLENENIARTFAESKPNLFRRIWEAIQRVWERITGKGITGQQARDYKRSSDMIRSIINNLDRIPNIAETMQTDTGAAEQETSAEAGEPAEKASINVQTAAERETAKLKAQNEYLKKQFKLSEKISTSKSGIAKAAKEIAKDYSYEGKSSEISENLSKLYDYMANGENGDMPNGDEVFNRAKNIAREIVENASEAAYDPLEDSTNREMLSTIRNTRISLSSDIKSDAAIGGGYDNFEQLRKKNFGKLKITKDGIPVETLYQELSEQYPDYFPDNITHPSDQLARMIDVANSMDTVYGNPFEKKIDETAEYLANDIVNRFFDIPQERPTFADRKQKEQILAVGKETVKREKQALQYEKKIDALKHNLNASKLLVEHTKSEAQAKLKAVTEAKKDAISKVKAQYGEAKKAQNAEQRKRILRAKIKRQFEYTVKLVTNPNDKQHIPDNLRSAVAEFFTAIQPMFIRENGTLESPIGGGRSAAAIYKIHNLADKLDKVISDSESSADFVDPDLSENISELKKAINAHAYSEFNEEDLQLFYKTVMAVNALVKNQNHLFTASQNEFASDIGDMTMDELHTNKPFNIGNKAVLKVNGLFNFSMVTPYDFFHSLGDTMKLLYKEGLRKGFDKKVTLLKQAKDFIQNTLGDIDVDKWSGKNAELKTYKLDVGEIQFTPAQAMSLYLLGKQEQSRNHILKGGAKHAPIEIKNKFGLEKIIKSYEVSRLTSEDIDSIANSLTNEQKRIADAIGKFFTEVTAQWGNETSLILYGYRKFIEKNYFPIVTDSNYNNTVIGQVNDKTLKNMGVTKSRIEGAANPIVIEDIFDVFARQTDQMSSYNAFVPGLTDIQRIYNYKTPGGSVKEAIEKKYGQQATSYFTKFITDMNGGIHYDTDTEFFRSLISKYKAARVGMSLSVIAQQPTSYIRAAAIMDPKYLNAGISQKGDWDKVLKYSPIAQWKEWGYFSLDTGKSIKDMILGKKSLSDTTMWAAGKADTITWGKLWNAVEAEISDKNKSLKYGTDEYYKAVSERFSEIIDRTQVIDSILHRSQIQRSTDNLVKMSVAFMSEPIKSYNLVRTAGIDYFSNKNPDTSKKFSSAVIAVLANIAIADLIKSLIEAARDDDEEENFLKLTLANYANNLVGEVPSTVPLLRDAYSILQGYSVNRMDMAGFSELINALRRAYSDKYTLEYKIADVGSKAADIFGVPFSNVRRDTKMIVNRSIDSFGSPLIEYEAMKLYLNIDYEGSRATYYNLLYKAYKTNTAEYNKIRSDMLKHGYNGEQISAAMKSRKKKEQAKK